MKKLLLTSIAILLFSGCATFTASTSYDPQKKPNDGLVLVSFHQTFDVIKWMYRNLNDSKGIEGFDEKFISTVDSFNNLIRAGNHIIYPFKLKPGHYEFFRWTQPEFYPNKKSTDHFSIEFEVLPGAVTYIGNILMLTDGERALMRVRDKSQIDIPAFLKEYSNVSNEEIITRIGILHDPENSSKHN